MACGSPPCRGVWGAGAPQTTAGGIGGLQSPRPGTKVQVTSVYAKRRSHPSACFVAQAGYTPDLGRLGFRLSRVYSDPGWHRRGFCNTRTPGACGDRFWPPASLDTTESPLPSTVPSGAAGVGVVPGGRGQKRSKNMPPEPYTIVTKAPAVPRSRVFRGPRCTLMPSILGSRAWLASKT